MAHVLGLTVLYISIGIILGIALLFTPRTHFIKRLQQHLVIFSLVTLLWFPISILSWIVVPFIKEKVL